MSGHRAPRARCWAVAAAAFAAFALPPVPVQAAGAVTVAARIDDRPLRSGTETKPIRLDPDRPSVLSVEVVNRGPAPVEVRTVRLEGRVVGLTFFAYDTAVALTLSPGQRGDRRFTLDLGGLDGQATGLIPGAVKLLDAERGELAAEHGVVDVRGSLRSVYGIFGLGVAILTLVSFLGALIGLARHRLPPNRWRRSLRFLTPGIGLGLLVNFTLSATRVFVPGLGRWLTICVVSAAVLFGFGYLTPSPETGEEDEEEEEEELERLAALPPPPPVAALEAQPAAPALEAAAAPALEAPAAAALPPPSPASPTVPTPAAPPTISTHPDEH